jgi:hypothetical protein
MGCYKSIKALVSGVQPQQPSVGNPFNVNVVQFGMPPQPAAAGAAAAAAAAAKKPAFSFGGPPSSVVDKKRPLEDAVAVDDEDLPPEIIEAKKKGMR